MKKYIINIIMASLLTIIDLLVLFAIFYIKEINAPSYIYIACGYVLLTIQIRINLIKHP